MINVPGKYRPYADRRYIEPEASFELIDLDAADTATVTAGAYLPFSKPMQLVDKVTTMSQKVATAEPGEWVLDGSYVPIKRDGDNGEIGLWSATMSNINGATSYSIIINLSNPASFRAITLVFDDATNNYATEFTLTAYNSSGASINNKSFADNDKAIVVADFAAQNCTKLIISVTKTNKPQRHVRLCEVLFGYLRVFDGNDISSVSYEYNSSIYAESFPSNKMVLTLDNTDRRYNIINPVGIYKYLQKGQGFNGSILINGSRVAMGRFYFDNSASDDNAMSVKVTAYDRAYALDDIDCNIGASGTWTVSEAVAAVITASGLNINTVIPSGIGSRIISKAIPAKSSCRDALRLIAQAGMCVCFFNRFDELEFVEPDIAQSVDNLDNNNMTAYPTVSDNGLINSVIITAKDEFAEEKTEITYTASDIGEDEEEKQLKISNPLVTSDTVAQWILDCSKYRIGYDIKEQGNPAREIQDVVKIADVYGEDKNGIVIKQTITAGIGLTGSIKAVTKYE